MGSWKDGKFEMKYDYSISCEKFVNGDWSGWSECDCDKGEMVRFKGDGYQQEKVCECEDENVEKVEVAENTLSDKTETKIPKVASENENQRRHSIENLDENLQSSGDDWSEGRLYLEINDFVDFSKNLD